MIDFLIVNHKYLDDEHTMSWIVDGPYPGSSAVSIDCRIESMKKHNCATGPRPSIKKFIHKVTFKPIKRMGNMLASFLWRFQEAELKRKLKFHIVFLEISSTVWCKGKVDVVEDSSLVHLN